MKTILIIFILCLPLVAGTYWVDDDGAETWANAESVSPLSGASATTYALANTNAAAGDTVYFRVGTYTVSANSAIDPANAGVSGNTIVFMAYNSEVVTFNYTGSTTYHYAVDLNSDSGPLRSWIVIDGLIFTNFIGHMWILKGDHNEVKNCSFSGQTVETGWRGSTIYRDARYNHIHDNSFFQFGFYTPNASGVVFELGNEAAGNDSTQRNVIEDNHMYSGGHHVMGMNGHHNIIRNNYFHNEVWYEYDGDSSGFRVTFMVGEDDDDERNLVEGNRIAYGGPSLDNNLGGSGGSIASRWNIIRKNMYYQNAIYAGKFLYYSGQGTSNRNKFYNNVIWHNGHDRSQTGKATWSEKYTHGLYMTESVSCSANVITNNIFYDNYNSLGGNLIVTEQDGTEPDLQTITGNWRGDRDGNPLFTSIAGTPNPAQEEQFDFSLQSSSGCNGYRFGNIYYCN